MKLNGNILISGNILDIYLVFKKIFVYIDLKLEIFKRLKLLFL